MASFHDFPARAYLEKYYSYVGAENASMLRALVDFARHLEPRLNQVVEVGCGPSIVPLLALTVALGAPRHIVFLDIAPANLSEVSLWLAEDARRFDYGAIIKWLEIEYGVDPNRVESDLRSAQWELRETDLGEPLPQCLRARFDVVSSHFFAESATADRNEFERLLHDLTAMGRPGASVFLSLMRRSVGYSVAGQDYPALPVDEQTLTMHLTDAGAHFETLDIRSVPAEQPPTRPGYEGMVFAAGRLSPVPERKAMLD